MVKRVIIRGGASSAMIVSLPGYDAETATLNQTCFDSRWSGLIPFLSGQISRTGTGTSSASFGQTLDQPPLFVGHVQAIGASGTPTTTFGTTPYKLQASSDEYFLVDVGVAGMNFSVNGWGNSILRLTYTLFKRP